MFYFTREGLERLEKKIAEIYETIGKLLKGIGDACQEGGDTWHDNFAYEDGVRQQAMWSERVRELIRIKNQAKIVEVTPSGCEVRIGRIVTIQDIQTQKTQILKIGSYMTFCEDEVSYDAPISRLLEGAKVGEIRIGEIGGERRILRILEIK